jgi:lysyl-tRNA synthetase class 2
MSSTLRARLARRAALAAGIRTFFAQRDVLEVGTELSVTGVTDVHLDSVALADGRYLRTSPEFAHKRLLAAGAGDLYELGPVARAGEHGRHHRREFWMLEWYRVGWDARRLADEVVELIRTVGPERPWTIEHTTWTKQARLVLGFDPHSASESRLAEALSDAPAGLDRLGLYDWLLAVHIQPRLPADRLTVVHEFPACQAALARLCPDDHHSAERFEVFAGPLELANGYHELTDPQEQRRRFDRDNAERARLGRPAMPVDEGLLAALEAGLPDCAGVALGFERLLMAVHGLEDIADAEGG